MELGRECLAIWGYKRVDELVWVKTIQLQRLRSLIGPWPYPYAEPTLQGAPWSWGVSAWRSGATSAWMSWCG